MVERGRPQMAIWRMSVTRWITKATGTNAEYVILIAFPQQQQQQQQRLREHASILRDTRHPRSFSSFRTPFTSGFCISVLRYFCLCFSLTNCNFPIAFIAVPIAPFTTSNFFFSTSHFPTFR